MRAVRLSQKCIANTQIVVVHACEIVTTLYQRKLDISNALQQYAVHIYINSQKLGNPNWFKNEVALKATVSLGNISL